jgi:hypothetical protein
MEWILGILGGAAGGVGAGAGVKQNKLGSIVNGVLGAVGGAGGTAIVTQLMGGGVDGIEEIAGNLVGGGAMGAIVATVVGFIANMMGKKKD